jgi:serine/threonine protein kinase
LIDRHVSDEAIAEDLDILSVLHRSRRAAQADGNGSQAAIAGASELEDRAEDDRSGPTVVMPDEKDPPAGVEPMRRIGKYIVIERLDSGGQAEVFRVVHPALGKELVLKLARRPIATGIEGRADAAWRDRTMGEGRLMARCDHPNLVRVFDLDIHEGRPFLVMEYVPGLTLDQFADQRRPSPRQSAQLVAALAQAVAYVHDRGIVHQDIKPRNILVDDRGRPRLIDFGLALQRHAWSVDAADWSGGTAAYMSPEQAEGRTDRIGPRTDIFGLGGLLYHLLTGRPLYRGASRVSRLRQAMSAEYLPVRQVNRRVPRALERICHKALAPDPERRHRTAVELERDLRRFLARRRVAAAGLVLASLLAVALAAPFLPGGPPPSIGNSVNSNAGPGLFILSSVATPVGDAVQLTSVGAMSITGPFAGDVNTTYRIEFFTSPAQPTASPWAANRDRQGKTFLGFKDVTKQDAHGKATFTFSPTAPIPVGQFVTTTITPTSETSPSPSARPHPPAGPAPLGFSEVLR